MVFTNHVTCRTILIEKKSFVTDLEVAGQRYLVVQVREGAEGSTGTEAVRLHVVTTG